MMHLRCPPIKSTLRRGLVAATLFAAASCNDPVAQQRSAARSRAVAADLDSARKWESERPADVAADIREIGVIARENERQRRSNDGWYNFMWKKEVQEWNENQGNYARQIQKEFAGDPKRAHDTAVQFLD